LPSYKSKEAALVERRQLGAMTDFSSGLFECCDDDDECANATCCICCQFGKNAEALNDPEWMLGNDCGLHAGIHGLLMIFWTVSFGVPAGAFGGLFRTQVRKKQGLKQESIIKDVAIHACCCCCAVAQERKQLGAPLFCKNR